MTNKNVIEIIDRLIKCGSAGTYSATPSEIFTAIVHGYYYKGSQGLRYRDKAEEKHNAQRDDGV